MAKLTEDVQAKLDETLASIAVPRWFDFSDAERSLAQREDRLLNEFENLLTPNARVAHERTKQKSSNQPAPLDFDASSWEFPSVNNNDPSNAKTDENRPPRGSTQKQNPELPTVAIAQPGVSNRLREAARRRSANIVIEPQKPVEKKQTTSVQSVEKRQPTSVPKRTSYSRPAFSICAKEPQRANDVSVKPNLRPPSRKPSPAPIARAPVTRSTSLSRPQPPKPSTPSDPARKTTSTLSNRTSRQPAPVTRSYRSASTGPLRTPVAPPVSQGQASVASLRSSVTSKSAIRPPLFQPKRTSTPAVKVLNRPPSVTEKPLPEPSKNPQLRRPVRRFSSQNPAPRLPFQSTIPVTPKFATTQRSRFSSSSSKDQGSNKSEVSSTSTTKKLTAAQIQATVNRLSQPKKR